MNGSLSDHHHLADGQVLVADLAGVKVTGASGVAWSLDSPQLNANLVTIQSGDQIDEHVNNEVDVLMVAESGAGEIVIDGEVASVGPASVILIPRGARRLIRSATGLAYYSIHQRRSGLSIG